MDKKIKQKNKWIKKIKKSKSITAKCWIIHLCHQPADDWVQRTKQRDPDNQAGQRGCQTQPDQATLTLAGFLAHGFLTLWLLYQCWFWNIKRIYIRLYMRINSKSYSPRTKKGLKLINTLKFHLLKTVWKFVKTYIFFPDSQYVMLLG